MVEPLRRTGLRSSPLSLLCLVEGGLNQARLMRGTLEQGNAEGKTKRKRNETEQEVKTLMRLYSVCLSKWKRCFSILNSRGRRLNRHPFPIRVYSSRNPGDSLFILIPLTSRVNLFKEKEEFQGKKAYMPAYLVSLLISLLTALPTYWWMPKQGKTLFPSACPRLSTLSTHTCDSSSISYLESPWVKED